MKYDGGADPFLGARLGAEREWYTGHQRDLVTTVDRYVCARAGRDAPESNHFLRRREHEASVARAGVVGDLPDNCSGHA